MRELEKLKLPYKYYLFHNVSFFSESYFQMDILLISPYFAMVLEVKNISGSIEIKKNPSILIRTKNNGAINSYKSPVPQLQEYIYQLTQLFSQNKVKLPVQGAIIFAFASSCVISAPTDTTIILTNEVRKFLRGIDTNHQFLKDEELDRLKDLLMNKNKEFNSFPLSRHYSIDPLEIKTGIECANCGFLGIKKTIRNWICPSCRKFTKSPTKKTMRDYFLIYKETINNQECRRFFHLENKHAASRILTNSQLIKTGQAKNTKYTMILLK